MNEYITPSHKMQDSGLKLVQLRSQDFAKETKRQSLITQKSQHTETGSLAFIEQVANW